MAMQERMVVHPKHGQAWFHSACAVDALVQAATEWGCPFADLLEGFRRGEVRVKVRKEKE